MEYLVRDFGTFIEWTDTVKCTAGMKMEILAAMAGMADQAVNQANALTAAAAALAAGVLIYIYRHRRIR